MSRPTKVRAHPDVVFQKLGDEAVLLNLRTGVYWGLDRSGAAVWDQIVARGELAEIVTALQHEFANSEAEIRSMVRNLLADLTREGLVLVEDKK